ncbi:hypothetical protein HPB47_019695 [Ixodes persulcatus]|uniref:Uncharacterized protein n=1 Tax=Ixodes persulcatus TaxID=34615 RepID=A0AC60QJY5_IXOPE|nr:hypothetical protein HPB47_019695 [Ixodes persulcatus]
MAGPGRDFPPLALLIALRGSQAHGHVIASGRARLLIECPDEKLCPATRAPGDQRAPNDGFPATAAEGLASDPNLDTSAPERFG